MKKIFFLFSILLVSYQLSAQTINITDPDFTQSNPINCANFQDGGAQNFFDNGAAGNYAPNSKDTFTVCPDINNQTMWPKITAFFGTNIGFTYDIHPTDTLYVFDGPNTNAPLLGMLNNGINPNGGSFVSSFENNPSGCLTFVFHSDATNEGTGWAGGLTCGNPPQPYFPHIEAFVNGSSVNSLNPIDTGYVNVCLGDTILLVAKPEYPYSFENTGVGYSQNLNNTDFSWDISNGSVVGTNDSIYFIPTSRNGFYVSLTMEDIFPNIVQTFCKIRVSQLPSFEGTGPLDPVICINETVELIGGATPTDTVGVAFPPGAFVLGGTVAGLTYLPDGSGQNYSTTINMTDFDAGATFTSPSDLQDICVTMEHSFLGDLEMWLTCPNGTEVTLFNANAGAQGHIPGGFGGGSTYLGGANDTGNGTAGVGFEYCFSEVNNTWGNFQSQFQAGNFVQAGTPVGNSMNPNGIYLPEESFASFVGCPLNGDWTITVRDNQGIDDGYIFEWGLYFDSGLFPNNETYQNTIIDEYWMNDPTIIAGTSDTAIIVLPTGPGTHPYTYVVEDDYGCFYDTTVNVIVKQPIVLNMKDTICELFMTTTLNTGTNDGQWSYYNSVGIPTFTADNVNTTINFPTYGQYNLVYSDTSCTNKDTARVFVKTSPYFNLDSDFFNCPFDSEYLVFKDSNEIAEYHWGSVVPAQDTMFSINLYQGTYHAWYISKLGCYRDTTFTITTRPENVLGNYGLVCNDVLTMTNNTGWDGGLWTSPNGNGTVTFEDLDSLNTVVTFTQPGTYILDYTDDCETDQTTVIYNINPTVAVDGGYTCVGVPFSLNVIFDSPSINYLWDTGESGPSIQVMNDGVYTVTASNNCGSNSASAVVQFIPCVLEIPNVFTPNGSDDANSYFQLIESNGLIEFTCIIFNRWGNIVQEFDKADFKWDGKTKGGVDCSEGVYFYKINAKNVIGEVIEKQGSVTLVRK